MTQTHAVITDEILARNRARIGQVWTPREPFFNTQATRDTIRHFVDGIGDRNPLFRDREYARKTRYGHLVAPGCFLYSIYYPIGRGATMPGIHGLIGGIEWEWFRLLPDGDEFTPTVTLTDIVEKKGRISSRIIVGYDLTEYKNQHDQVVARARGWTLHFERGDAGQRGKNRDVEKARYTPEELQKIYNDYDLEIVRGATPRYWDDVQVGEELCPVVKGPLSQRDLIVWNMGAGSAFMKAHGIYLDYQRRHPAVGMLNTATGEVDVPELVHFQDTRANEIGANLAYDYGYQRISWLGNLLTNWVGDDGFVKRLRAELRGLNYVGDTTWCKGKVIKKYLDENSEPCVDIECWGENQRGEVTMPGKATVILPSREKGTSPLDTRLK